MKILYIGLKDLLLTLKDKKALALLVLMPIALIFVLGMGLNSAFENSVKINKFDVAVTDYDKGEYSKEFISFLKSKEIKKIINLKEMNEDAAKTKVKSGKLPVLIVIPEGYSNNIKKGEKTEIKIFSDAGSSFDANTVESFVKSYTGTVSSIEAAAEASDKEFKKYKLSGTMIIPSLMKITTSNNTSKRNESNVKASNNLSAMQYYSAAMLAMYILFVATIGTGYMIQEREDGTLSRLQSTTVSRFQILSGKLLGTFFIGIFDVVILVLFTKLLFNVDWGNSILGLIFLSLSMIFATCGFSVFLSVIFKTSKAADVSGSVIIMIMSFIGGSMYPLSAMPTAMQEASKIMPNNWALRGYLSLMINGGFNSIIKPSIVLLAIGTAFLLIGTLKFKYE